MSKWGNHQQQGLHRSNVHDKTKREGWSSTPELFLIHSSVHTRSVPLSKSHLTSIQLLEFLAVGYILIYLWRVIPECMFVLRTQGLYCSFEKQSSLFCTDLAPNPGISWAVHQFPTTHPNVPAHSVRGVV